MTIDSWLSAGQGDASGFWLMSLLADWRSPKRSSGATSPPCRGADAARGAALLRSAPGRSDSILGDPGTEFIWGGGRLPTRGRRPRTTTQYSPCGVSNVETLLIGGALDVATPAADRDGASSCPYLPNGHQVVLTGFGHTTDFWSDQPAAGTRLVNTFLDTGRVDDSLYTPRTVDFTPEHHARPRSARASPARWSASRRSPSSRCC